MHGTLCGPGTATVKFLPNRGVYVEASPSANASRAISGVESLHFIWGAAVRHPLKAWLGCDCRTKVLVSHPIIPAGFP